MSRDVAIVIGTVVGGYFGEPGLGYTLGSLVGNAYDPVQIGKQGPRLNDLKVQTANYGKMIPKLYGASRFAGNIIWATDIAETANSETSGGGLFGGPEVTTTTYTYTQSFAVGLCEGEVACIGRIWANGKLIYNANSDADSATIAASRELLPFMRFYTGSEIQAADSLIEVDVGTGNAPAYRGTAYVVFENLPLARFFNRTPNLEFEILESSADTSTLDIVTGSTIATTAQGMTLFGGHYLATLRATTAPNGILEIYDVASPTAPRLVSSRTIPSGYPSGLGNCIASNNSGLLYLVSIYGYFTVVDVALPSQPSIIGTLSGFGSNNIVSVIPKGRIAYLLGWLSNKLYVVSMAEPSSPLKIEEVTTRTSPQRGFIADGFLYIAHYGDGYLQIWDIEATVLVYNGAEPRLIGEVDTGTSATDVTVLGNYAFINTSGLHVYDVTDKAAPVLVATLNIGSTLCLLLTNLGHLAAATTSGLRLLDISDPVNPAVIITQASETSVDALGESGGNIYALAISSSVNALFYSGAMVSRVPAALGGVVSNICVRAGMGATQIDATQLTSVIDGYVVQRSTARAQIEQLMQTFFFDAVESDGKVKFIMRGGAAALTIAEDDLAAHLYGGQTPENLTIERKQEMELPVEVNIQYMDLAASYQTNSQRSQRLTTPSYNKIALNFAISMNASKAKQVSDVLMYDAWTSRTSFAMSNAWKYSYLEPTDIVEVTKGSRTYNMRLIDEDSSSGVFQRSAVLDDASVYTQTAVAAPPPPPGSIVGGLPMVDVELMDIPLLRDQDDGIGFYGAACKYSGTWSGAQTYKSNDGGASWLSFGRAFLNEATIGAASTALGDFHGGNIFDELNSVVVVMINGTLSSATELGVLNGANVILVGSEVLQFKTATLVAAGTYTLTGLLRGRRGTEWAISTHDVGDRVVLLTELAAYLFASSTAEYNLQREYKAAMFGSVLDDAYAISFTNTGVAQECYSPVLLGGGRDAANNLRLSWTRRTRIGGAWNNYSDVPVGEATEAYVVEIYSSSAYTTLLRTISGITSATTTYTAAQQTADGLTPGNTVYWIVYQVSATVGNGYGARGAT